MSKVTKRNRGKNGKRLCLLECESDWKQMSHFICQNKLASRLCSISACRLQVVFAICAFYLNCEDVVTITPIFHISYNI